MSDSIVLILTLKFLGCFLNSEFNPIFAAKALAMSNGDSPSKPVDRLVQLKEKRYRRVTSSCLVAGGRWVVRHSLGVRRQRRRACDRRSSEMLHNFRWSLREWGTKNISMCWRRSLAAKYHFKFVRKYENCWSIRVAKILPAKKKAGVGQPC